MITKTIQITEVTIDELADKVADKLLLKIEGYLKELSKSKNDEFVIGNWFAHKKNLSFGNGSDALQLALEGKSFKLALDRLNKRFKNIETGLNQGFSINLELH